MSIFISGIVLIIPCGAFFFCFWFVVFFLILPVRLYAIIFICGLPYFCVRDDLCTCLGSFDPSVLVCLAVWRITGAFWWLGWYWDSEVCHGYDKLIIRVFVEVITIQRSLPC